MQVKNNNKGFTLIEIIIYCSIFVIFGVVSIESMIYLNSRMGLQRTKAENVDYDVYKIYFSSMYNRLNFKNPKIEAIFYDLIASSSVIVPELIEDSSLGIILRKDENILIDKKLEMNKIENKVILFDSITSGV